MTDRPEDAGNGVLFRNDKREKPSQPEFKGECTIKGKRFWLAAWVKTSEKSGQKFFSLAFREAEEQKPKPNPNRRWRKTPKFLFDAATTDVRASLDRRCRPDLL
jgi:hypothetical protein